MVVAVEPPPPCPFTSVRLREGEREFFRSPIKMYSDQDWTLRRPVELSTSEDVPEGALLVWCVDSTEVMALEWNRARHWLGDRDRIPAGTSLLQLIEEM